MATLIPGKSLRNNLYGTRVERAAAALPQTTTQTLFTLTGGRAIITTLIAECTTAVQAQANALSLFSLSTTTNITTHFAQSFESNGLALGSLLSVTGTTHNTQGSAGLMQVGSAVIQNNEIVMQPGAIRLTAAASNTGALRWTLLYVPFDDGAIFVAS